jgi:hypothetical protein
MRSKRIPVAAAVLAAAATVALAGPADAATGKNGVVESGDSNFSGDVFPGTSISANNNTESYRNRDSFWWHVFTGSSYTGSHGCLPAGYVGNASATFKNTISSAYYSSSSC